MGADRVGRGDRLRLLDMEFASEGIRRYEHIVQQGDGSVIEHYDELRRSSRGLYGRFDDASCL